jgi:sugar phosphate isomerase/epimerase
MIRLATCNEPWRDLPFAEVCRRVAHLGYVGIELAPFTLAKDVGEISAQSRREIARTAADHGLEIIGLHWLLVGPEGLHLTSADETARVRAAEYLQALADFCGDVGGKVMTFGSPKQRNIEPPVTFEDGWRYARDVFAVAATRCAARDVYLCIEALSAKETNFINTAEQALELVEDVWHANIGIMLDIKAMTAMPEGVVGTIRRFGAQAKHFHANLPSGRGVGMPPAPGDEAVELVPAMRALVESGYDGWVSCEPFDYTPDPDAVAAAGLKALSEALSKT